LYRKTGVSLMEKCDTIPKLIQHNYEKWGDRPAMCMKQFGVWQRYSWQEYYQKEGKTLLPGPNQPRSETGGCGLHHRG